MRPWVSSRLLLDEESVFRKPCNRARWPRHFEDVQSSVGPINNIDKSALIGLNIIALYRNLARILPIDLDATLVCCGRNRWDEVANFFRMIRVSYV